jgi:hypothetical protein
MPGSWIASPVESKIVMSRSDRRPSAVPMRIPELSYVLTSEQPGLHGVHDVAVVRRLFGEVADPANRDRA